MIGGRLVGTYKTQQISKWVSLCYETGPELAACTHNETVSVLLRWLCSHMAPSNWLINLESIEYHLERACSLTFSFIHQLNTSLLLNFNPLRDVLLLFLSNS